MIHVVDYGMGNLRSVSKALEHLGASVTISSSPADILKANKIVLPGVGAFGDAMQELKERGLIAPLKTAFKSNIKILGICLGLQLFFDSSEESPNSEGLGFFKGTVQSFRSKNVKIPHMGWNDATPCQDHALLKGLPCSSFFYFVHSFYAVPDSVDLAAAKCTYGDETFPAMIGSKNTFATQFHPEKSQEAGLLILKNFIQW